MALVNGLLCLIVATILLVQIKKIQNGESNQFFQKFIWIHWGLLMIIGIHRIFSGFTDPFFGQLLSALNPLSDIMNATGGLLLALYLRSRNEKVKGHEI